MPVHTGDTSVQANATANIVDAARSWPLPSGLTRMPFRIVSIPVARHAPAPLRNVCPIDHGQR